MMGCDVFSMWMIVICLYQVVLLVVSGLGLRNILDWVMYLVVVIGQRIKDFSIIKKCVFFLRLVGWGVIDDWCL